MGNELVESFLRYVCQTSSEPLGIVVARARGAQVWDQEGRAYLDLLSGMGVANIGHSHPAVLRAIAEQVQAYLHVSVYGETVQRPQVEFARRLAELTPGDLTVTYFTNSGTEAVEGALKTARKFTGRARLVAFEAAFHGDTLGALSVGGNPLYRRPFEPLLPEVEVLPFDDVRALDRIDTSVAAVIVEPIQAEGGVRIPDDAFLPALRRRCSDVGALLIADEVLTGFGRTGKLFACANWEVVPDLLVLAKALGGGMPLGAFVGAPDVMRTLSHDPPLAHVTTFGGHPVSCAAGWAALECLIQENLIHRAAQVGDGWLKQLRALVGGPVRAVRGKGLLLALEFAVADATRRFVSHCFERGLILNWTLHRDTVVRLAPPLSITEDEIAYASAVMAEALH
jgi:acetylornithine/N-succinyldiaminopimelate aminotransferase